MANNADDLNPPEPVDLPEDGIDQPDQLGWFGRLKKALSDFWSDDLLWVLIGGAGGGVMWPYLAKIVEADSKISSKTFQIALSGIDHLLFGFFGLIAAGFTVYVLSDTKRQDYKRLFFFSLIAGLTFPTILVDATGGKDAENQELVATSGENATAQTTDLKGKLVKQIQLVRQSRVNCLDEASRELIVEDTNQILSVAKLPTATGQPITNPEINNLTESLNGYLGLLKSGEECPSDNSASTNEIE